MPVADRGSNPASIYQTRHRYRYPLTQRAGIGALWRPSALPGDISVVERSTQSLQESLSDTLRLPVRFEVMFRAETKTGRSGREPRRRRTTQRETPDQNSPCVPSGAADLRRRRSSTTCVASSRVLALRRLLYTAQCTRATEVFRRGPQQSERPPATRRLRQGPGEGRGREDCGLPGFCFKPVGGALPSFNRGSPVACSVLSTGRV